MRNPFKKEVDLTPAIRGAKESFVKYKKRRAKRNQILKDKLKPKPFWNTSKKGTLTYKKQ